MKRAWADFSSDSEEEHTFPDDRSFASYADPRGSAAVDWSRVKESQDFWSMFFPKELEKGKDKVLFQNKNLFIEWACGRPARSESAGPPLSKGFRSALIEMFMEKENIKRVRATRLKWLKAKLETFSSQHEKWLKSVSPAAKKLVGKCNPFFFRWLLKQTKYDNVECANILQHGAEVVGELGGRASWPPIPPR